MMNMIGPKKSAELDSELSIEDVAKISAVIEDDNDDERNVFVIDDSWDDEPERGVE